MNFLNLLKSLLNLQKKIDTKILPSQGLFYKNDFEIIIKKADVADIIEYELDYIKDDIGIIIKKVKKIVQKNIILTHGYKFDDLKSIDIIFVFLEIVKFTKGESIKVNYFDEDRGKEDIIEFSNTYFNYFKVDENIKKHYDSENKCFTIDGFKYSLPAIGVETSLTNFLLFKSNHPDAHLYKDYFYDFTYFLSDKNELSFNEIENLIQVFNHDLDKNDIKKVKKIVSIFSSIQKYSLIKNGKVIDINSKIDLEKIWK